MSAELAIFGAETGAERGHLRSTVPAGECVLGWAAALRAALKLGICPNRCADCERLRADLLSLPPGPQASAFACARRAAELLP